MPEREDDRQSRDWRWKSRPRARPPCPARANRTARPNIVFERTPSLSTQRQTGRPPFPNFSKSIFGRFERFQRVIRRKIWKTLFCVSDSYDQGRQSSPCRLLDRAYCNRGGAIGEQFVRTFRAS